MMLLSAYNTWNDAEVRRWLESRGIIKPGVKSNKKWCVSILDLPLNRSLMVEIPSSGSEITLPRATTRSATSRGKDGTTRSSAATSRRPASSTLPPLGRA